MFLYVLYGLFILACVVLIIVVLLQPGKADAGALFSSSVSSTAFGPRGTQTLLAKITIGAAAAFMLIALVLSLPALSGSRSVIQSTQPDANPTPQASPAATALPLTPAPATPAPSAAASSDAGTSNANSNAKAAASPAATAKPKASPAATKK
ncbi:MAG: preprotein translocase subunit SecG [Acidobacteria bacterium]|nr:preprotein translocase subunit SecG [Acidobacteriota bacterium]